MARTIAGELSSEPHNLDVVEVGLADALSGHDLLHSLSAWTGLRLDAAVIAQVGWPHVDQQLGVRCPDVVVAGDAVAAAAASAWRDKGHLPVPIVGVVCGLRVDPAWARSGVNRLSVVDEAQAQQAASALGMPDEVLVPSGVPLCAGFSSVSSDDRLAIRERFELPTDRPVVLTVTDGMASDEITGALFQLSMVAERAALMFDVARHDEAADVLRRRAALYDVEARMFGKVTEAGQLWAAADVVVAKPHIYVEQRALVQRLPVVFLLPEGDAGLQTAQAWVEREIGRKVEHISTLAADVELALRQDFLAEARATIAAITRRSASRTVARLVAQAAKQSRQILAESHHRREPRPGATRDGGDQAQGRAAARGPLEVIGAPREPRQGEEREVLAQDLEVSEAIANRQVSEHQQEVARWTQRARLAASKGDDELERAARREAERHQESMHRALAELARLAERRLKLESRKAKQRRLERDFHRMELDDALAQLKRKMGHED